MSSEPVVPKIQRIACVGAGYVGGPTSAVLAHKCPHIQVTVCDMNRGKIDQWNSPQIPIFEVFILIHRF